MHPDLASDVEMDLLHHVVPMGINSGHKQEASKKDRMRLRRDGPPASEV